MDELIQEIESLLANALTIRENKEKLDIIVNDLSRGQEPEKVARLLYVDNLQYAKALYDELEYWMKHEPQDKSKYKSL